jgi:hypothetical protein
MFKNEIRAAASGIAAAVVAISTLGPASVASASPINPLALDAAGTCSIQTVNGHYLTAVVGGGRTTDTIHSDATQVGAWEQFHVNCTQ